MRSKRAPSDIHIDPFEDRLRIRYRYDGVLHEAETPPRSLHAAVVSRIKIMAMLDIAGAAAAAGRPHQARSSRSRDRFARLDDSFCCTVKASSCAFSTVRRSVSILPRSEWKMDFVRNCARSRTAKRHHSGYGSHGKRQDHDAVHRPPPPQFRRTQHITVEDPIEYHLAGITQIQTKPQIGLNFASPALDPAARSGHHHDRRNTRY
jgi:general secretion pathway protein E